MDSLNEHPPSDQVQLLLAKVIQTALSDNNVGHITPTSTGFAPRTASMAATIPVPAGGVDSKKALPSKPIAKTPSHPDTAHHDTLPPYAPPPQFPPRKDSELARPESARISTTPSVPSTMLPPTPKSANSAIPHASDKKEKTIAELFHQLDMLLPELLDGNDVTEVRAQQQLPATPSVHTLDHISHHPALPSLSRVIDTSAPPPRANSLANLQTAVPPRTQSRPGLVLTSPSISLAPADSPLSPVEVSTPLSPRGFPPQSLAPLPTPAPAISAAAAALRFPPRTNSAMYASPIPIPNPSSGHSATLASLHPGPHAFRPASPSARIQIPLRRDSQAQGLTQPWSPAAESFTIPKPPDFPPPAPLRLANQAPAPAENEFGVWSSSSDASPKLGDAPSEPHTLSRDWSSPLVSPSVSQQQPHPEAAQPQPPLPSSTQHLSTPAPSEPTQLHSIPSAPPKRTVPIPPSLVITSAGPRGPASLTSPVRSPFPLVRGESTSLAAQELVRKIESTRTNAAARPFSLTVINSGDYAESVSDHHASSAGPVAAPEPPSPTTKVNVLGGSPVVILGTIEADHPAQSSDPKPTPPSVSTSSHDAPKSQSSHPQPQPHPQPQSQPRGAAAYPVIDEIHYRDPDSHSDLSPSAEEFFNHLLTPGSPTHNSLTSPVKLHPDAPHILAAKASLECTAGGTTSSPAITLSSTASPQVQPPIASSPVAQVNVSLGPLLTPLRPSKSHAPTQGHNSSPGPSQSHMLSHASPSNYIHPHNKLRKPLPFASNVLIPSRTNSLPVSSNQSTPVASLIHAEHSSSALATAQPIEFEYSDQPFDAKHYEALGYQIKYMEYEKEQAIQRWVDSIEP
ncbi:uncharacterized protein BJ171DRAFT_42574 [Polychytrium aggregatum]|uniref:uncharacterized protein n=1 Tax=Polychytrium aggregatum TaxID=110093 RepID=UPI0022FEE554|nr:uncharacterized protein BJ171DRAFT_42574 [Polychytrium aggregatum]KAI9206179.1 hypothetical protein BJ171DRAFT_42574 [Polychytrium aggregatum]